MVEPTYAQRFAKDAVDGLFKQAGVNARQGDQEQADIIDAETQQKLIKREIMMAADPDFALQETAKELATEKMRRKLDAPQATQERPPAQTADTKQDINKQIGETAKVLLASGVPPQVVAAYLTGAGTPQTPISFGGSTQGGLTLADVMALIDKMNSNKGQSDLERTLAEMREEIKSLKAGGVAVANTPPPKTAVDTLGELNGLVEALVKLGVVQKPGTGVVATGESIDIVKERNRHEEEMGKVSSERKYKESVANTFADIPIVLSEVAAQAITASSGQGAATKPAALTSKAPMATQLFICEECKTKMQVPIGTKSFKCPNPKCGAIYNDEPVTEQPPAKAPPSLEGQPDAG